MELVYFKHMEKMPNKITDIEIDSEIHENNERIKESEKALKEGIEVLRDEIRFLEDDVAYFTHMENFNETADILNEMAQELGKGAVKKYPDEEIAKVKAYIENARKTVDELGGLIAELTLQKVQIGYYTEEFEKLNEKFRTSLLKINKENLN